ncbi:MAG TPA: nodulation protein NfeD [Candidatus Dormibacteraeota bacterium]|nr:nodulation protein NfeD [Candidatus Dormibacteraeota bacterium]
MARWTWMALLLAPLLAAATPVPTPPGPTPAQAAGPVVQLTIDGTINAATVTYVREGLRTAQERGAAALLIELDTPGGLLESTRVIVKDILGAPLPVIVYIAPSGGGATSAGVFITLAAHVAAMAPGTNIGAAHPVGNQGETINGTMGEKVENFAASLSRTIAEQRGRNIEWAEQAVRKSVSATEREAVKLRVVDFVAADVAEVLVKASGRTIEVAGKKVQLALAGAAVEPLEMRLGQKVFDFLANPNLAYVLFMAGLLGLYVEFTNPGLLFPGVAGAICLVIGLAALQMLPVNYAGLALVLLGVGMLIAEAFLPSFGVVGIGGIVAFVIGSLLLFDTPEDSLHVDRGLIAGAAVTLGVFTLGIGWLVVRAQRRQPASGAEGMVGEVGHVRRVDRDGRHAKVFVHGEYWEADADEAVAIGDAVEVTAVEGLRLRVRRHAVT